MLDLLNRNFATLAMLLGLGMVLTTLVLLIMAGKITAESAVATGLVSLASAAVGGITGYSMHKTTDSAVQTPSGIQIAKSESQ